MKPSAAGHTLIEILVVVVIIGVVTGMLLRGYPVLRAHQQLKTAEQQIQSALREAQALALNETREEDCKNKFPDDLASQRLCSDIGVRFEEETITLFADLDSNDWYDDEPRDYFLTAIPITANGGVRVPTATAFVFRAKPPRVWLSTREENINGEQLSDSTYTLELELRAGQTTATLSIGPYGQVTRKNGSL